MITIVGDIVDIPRQRVPCPRDGVHRRSSEDGTMKGCHSMRLTTPGGAQKLLTRGATSFYFPYKPTKGVKIYQSLKHSYTVPMKIIKKEYKYRQIFYRAGISPKGDKLVTVELDISFRGKRKRGRVPALKTRHVDYPVKIWEAYARGIPYNFSGLDNGEHPEHTPAGYLRFCKRVKKIITKHRLVLGGGKPSLKIGDIIYSVGDKRWYLVDCL